MALVDHKLSDIIKNPTFKDLSKREQAQRKIKWIQDKTVQLRQKHGSNFKPDQLVTALKDKGLIDDLAPEGTSFAREITIEPVKTLFSKAGALLGLQGAAETAKATGEVLENQERSLVRDQIELQGLFPEEFRDGNFAPRVFSTDKETREKAIELELEKNVGNTAARQLTTAGRSIIEATQEQLDNDTDIQRIRKEASEGLLDINNIATIMNQSLGVMAPAALATIAAGPVGGLAVTSPILGGFSAQELEDSGMSAEEKLGRILVSGVSQAALEQIIPSRLVRTKNFKGIGEVAQNIILEGTTEASQKAIELVATQATTPTDIVDILSDPTNTKAMFEEFLAGALLGGVTSGTQQASLFLTEKLTKGEVTSDARVNEEQEVQTSEQQESAESGGQTIEESQETDTGQDVSGTVVEQEEIQDVDQNRETETQEGSDTAARGEAVEGGGQLPGTPEGEVGQRAVPREDQAQEVSLPSPEDAVVLEDVPVGQERRAFSEQVLNSPDIRQEVKDGLSEKGKFYTPISNEVTSREADAILTFKGSEQAFKEVTNIGNEIPPRTRIVLGEKLALSEIQKANVAEANGDNQQRDAHISTASAIFDSLAEQGTTLGQGVQAFATFSKLTPQGLLFKAQQEVKKGKRLKASKSKKQVQEPVKVEPSPEFNAKILKLAEEVQSLPEGSIQQNRKLQEYLAEIEREKGITNTNVSVALAYANVLSGPSTQEVNLISTFNNTLGLIAATLGQPSKWKFIPGGLASFYQGLIKGKLEAVNVLLTGEDPVKIGGKLNAPSTLELVKFRGLAKPLNAWKYVRRSLVAGDTFFFKAAEEFKAKMKAIELSEKQPNLKGKDRTRLIAEMLAITPELKAEAIEQAKLEKLKEGSRDFQRRVNQILESKRADQITEDAQHFAARATFNYEPEGVLGVFVRYADGLLKELPIGKIIIPFTRVVANVANTSLDYTFVGYKNVFLGKIATPGSKPVGEERKLQLAKATLGTVAMTTLYAIASMFDDEDNPFIQITALGPKNFTQRSQLMNTGWRPFTIKVGDIRFKYSFTPFLIPFSIIGYLKDRSRYDKEKEENSLIQVTNAILFGSAVIFDQTFLANASDFMGALANEDPERQKAQLKNLFSRSTGGILFPNFARQVQKQLDPTIPDAPDILTGFVRQVPVASGFLKPKLNVLGEPIRGDKPFVLGRVVTRDKRSNELWNYLNDNRIFISVPRKKQSFGDRYMEPDEFYEFTFRAGRDLRKELITILPDLKKLPPQEGAKQVKRITRIIRRQTKQEMLAKEITP